MARLLVAGLRVELEPDDVTGLGHDSRVAPSERFLAQRFAETDLVMQFV